MGRVGGVDRSSKTTETRSKSRTDPVQREVPGARAARGARSSFETKKKEPVSLHRSEFAPASPAATAAVERVRSATKAYEWARAEVTRLNGHLETALRTEPSLKDPKSAERFRASFQETHRAAYEAERKAAKDLAESLRAAEDPIRRDGARAPTLDNRLSVAEGLMALAGSSEYRQASKLAGQYAKGHDPALPREDMQSVAERAALTGLREDLSAGMNGEEAMRRAGTALGLAGIGLSTPALSAIGNAIGSGADLSAFMRTGDAASLGAAGFGVLGSAGAVAAIFGGGPISVGAAGIGLLGKTVLRGNAASNEYHAAIDQSLATTHGLSLDQAAAISGRSAQILGDAGLGTDELVHLAKTGGLDRAAELAWGGQLATGEYATPLDPAAYEARVKKLQAEEPGQPYAYYDSVAVDQLREESRAAGTGEERLLSDLRAAGLLP